MDLQVQPHPAVKRPDHIAGARKMVRFNDFLAIKLVALYGTAFAIWLFAAYSLAGALVGDKTLAHMLYWSNAAQLTFCPASLYVGNILQKQAAKKAEADHQALTHIANVVDKIADQVGVQDGYKIPPANF